MTSYTYNNYSHWKQITLQSIILGFDNQNHGFHNLGSDSFFNLKNIERPNDCGGTRNIALKYSARFSVAEKSFQTMKPTLQAISTLKALSLTIVFESLAEQENGGQLILWLSESNAEFMENSFSWEIKMQDSIPTLIIKMEGYSSLDILSTPSNIFSQNW